MIRELASAEPYRKFIEDCFRDPVFSASRELLEERLRHAAERPTEQLFGAFEGDEPTGLFSFTVLADERYLEMLVGLTHSVCACEEILDELRRRFPGWQADFVFHPEHAALSEALRRRGAHFDTAQHKMVLASPPPEVDTAGIMLLSERYLPQYLAMHNTNLYWTGDRTVQRPDRFRVLLAVDGDRVVGYLDATRCFDENEPVDLLVREEDRRRGWGRKLLAKAIELNRPNRMMLLVDVDNLPAIRLYESMGFVTAEGQDNQTVNWEIPE